MCQSIRFSGNFYSVFSLYAQLNPIFSHCCGFGFASVCSLTLFLCLFLSPSPFFSLCFTVPCSFFSLSFSFSLSLTFFFFLTRPLSFSLSLPFYRFSPLLFPSPLFSALDFSCSLCSNPAALCPVYFSITYIVLDIYLQYCPGLSFYLYFFSFTCNFYFFFLIL